MAFGQQAGPPAAATQVRELLTLLQEAGHTDFRDARGPMGFTQRQAVGKFTRDEAATLIDRLRNDASDPGPASDPGRTPPVPPPTRLPVVEQAMRGMPTEQLAAELRRRGWLVIEP